MNMRLEDLVEFQVGSPQFRIKESATDAATTYKFYSQNDLEEDLTGVELVTEEAKQIATTDEVTTVAPGDLVFSLISGRAPIVRKEHSVVSNIYRSQPIRPIVHHQQESPHHFVVSRVLPADSQKKLEHHVWNYQYNPHHSITRGNAHVVAHN